MEAKQSNVAVLSALSPSLLLGVSYSVSCSQCSPKGLLSSKFDDLHRFMCLKTRSPSGGAIFIYFSDFGGHLGIGSYSLA